MIVLAKMLLAKMVKPHCVVSFHGKCAKIVQINK